MDKTIEVSDEEAALLQKAAEGVGFALAMNLENDIDEKNTRKKAMDLYGAVLIEDLLKCPSFVSKVENAIVNILEERENDT